MKKTIFLVTFAFGITGAFAQDASGLTSKKGEPILPEKGDWALGIDAAPILNYIGNFLSSSGNNKAPTWGTPTNNNLSITGKYFKDEKTAYRAMVRIGFGSTKFDNFQLDQTNTVTGTQPQVTDTRTVSQHNIVLGAGIEKRKGKTRLQGYYGGMLMIILVGSDTTNSYGNAMNNTYPNPPSTNWSSGTVTSGTRITQNKAGSGFGIGLRAFIGAEYFILPKIAIGAEFGWGLVILNAGDGSVTKESLDANGKEQLVTQKTGGAKYTGLDTDVNHFQLMPTGTLNLTMHF
jgi:hypothetical protein